MSACVARYNAEVIAASDPSRTSGVVRLFWCCPLGFALIGLAEVGVQAQRLGSDGFVLAVALAGATGLVPAALFGLFGLLAHRRGWRWPDRLRVDADRFTLPVTLSLLLVLVGLEVIEAVSALFERRPIDSPAAAVLIWKGALVLALPVALVVGWIALRSVEQRITAWRWTATLRRIALTLLVLLGASQLCRGPFVLYFGGWAPLLAIVGGCVSAFGWIPRLHASRRSALITALCAVVLVVAGRWGAGHSAARALLLHDARVFPQVYAAVWAFGDSDGDGEIAAWLGGADCDDSNERVASWRPELPGNGIDDNCRGGDAVPADPVAKPGAFAPRRPNIVLVTVDTVRADHLGLHGYQRETMPRLRQWAERAQTFEHAWAPSNHTGFSMLSVLSGQSAEFLVREPKVLDAGGQKFTHWLPHHLSKLGYATVAVNPALVTTGVLPAKELRFDQIVMGPWDYRPKNRGTESMQVVDSAIGVLERRDTTRPVFMWLHIGDPHSRHEAHSRFGGTEVVDHYDDELAWVDLHLGRLFGAITATAGDDSIVIVTSDHGEDLGEREAWGHGFSLYETMLHVPLVVRAPDLTPGRVEHPVSVTSVVPTILDLIGEPAGPQVTAPSLTEPEAGFVFAGVPFFWSERRMEVAVTDGRWKLVRHRVAGTSVLFDLQADPAERRNLASAEPEAFERLARALDARLEEGR